jgi:hypothetical protein
LDNVIETKAAPRAEQDSAGEGEEKQQTAVNEALALDATRFRVTSRATVG